VSYLHGLEVGVSVQRRERSCCGLQDGTTIRALVPGFQLTSPEFRHQTKWQHDGALRVSVHGNREPSYFIESYEPGLDRVAISEGHPHLAKVWLHDFDSLKGRAVASRSFGNLKFTVLTQNLGQL
jgi:hypothetical protein